MRVQGEAQAGSLAGPPMFLVNMSVMPNRRAEVAPRTDFVLADVDKSVIPWFRRSILRWYDDHGRRLPWRERERTEYEVLIAELLLQRTTAVQVAQSFEPFIKKYPSWLALKRASQAQLAASLEPLGLSRQKARVLKALAPAVLERGGKLPKRRDSLQKLPGVGQYIASAVLTTLFGRREAFVDANMARVLERFWDARTYADIRDDPYIQTLARRVVNCQRALDLNWGVLDLGGLICRPRSPKCSDCPLESRCHASDVARNPL